MNHNKTKRPQYPALKGLKITGDLRSMYERGHRPGHATQQHTKTLSIATYNVRTLATEESLQQLLYEVEKINWNIIGLSEVRRIDEEKLVLKDCGHVIYWKGTQQRQHGVGFLVHKDIKENIAKYRGISERLAYLIINIDKSTTLKIIQVYAPTISYSQDEVDELYQNIESILLEEKTTNTIVMGDFNARLGIAQHVSKYIGPQGYGGSNDRGNTLAAFAQENKLYVVNTFFKKRSERRWTWMGPNGTIKAEIDYILTSNINIVKNYDVLNRVQTDSDHRMVRCEIKLNKKLERYHHFAKYKNKPSADGLKQCSTIYADTITTIIQEQTVKQTNRTLDEIEAGLKCIMKTAANKCVRKENKWKRKLADKTINLLERRKEIIQKAGRQSVQHVEINKLIRKCIKADLKTYQDQKIQEFVEANKGPKILRRKLSQGKKEIVSIYNESGEEIRDKDEIIRTIYKFYKSLYTDDRNTYIGHCSDTKQPVDINDIPEILESETMFAIKQMKCGKASGEDAVTPEMLKYGGRSLVKELTDMFNRCIHEQKIPTSWNNATIVLLHKKGDKKDLKNYRPISLLSTVYKLFTRILTNRLERRLDEQQPVEQAGFRKKYSTLDHIQTLTLLIQKCKEYNLPVYLGFVDFEKAFDSVYRQSIVKALETNGIDKIYIDRSKSTTTASV